MHDTADVLHVLQPAGDGVRTRMLKDFDKLLAVTKDERFVTARHCLQSLWKVGAAGPEQRRTVEKSQMFKPTCEDKGRC